MTVVIVAAAVLAACVLVVLGLMVAAQRHAVDIDDDECAATDRAIECAERATWVAQCARAVAGPSTRRDGRKSGAVPPAVPAQRGAGERRSSHTPVS